MSSHAKPVIGILGGIGSGKSLVAAALAGFGGHVINADRLGHDALRQPEIREQIIGRWGTAVVEAAGEIDRKKLGRVVFADPAELRALEALVFPDIERQIREEIAKANGRDDVPFVVLDAAIMMETGWHKVCDKTVFVDSPKPIRLQRLQDKRGWDAREVENREKAQMPTEEKKRLADAVVDNAAGPEAVTEQVRALLQEWQLVP